jgi:BASS family bile acid:Na+ symporter
MEHTLEVGIKISLAGFIVGHMLALGMRLSLGEIAAPLRRGRLVAIALFLNFVLCPVFAYLAARVVSLAIPLEPGYVVGLSILGGAAGSPLLPNWAKLAKGDEAFGVGLMVLLMGVTIVYVPAVLPRFVPGLTVDPLEVAKPLVIMIVLPFAAGLAAKARLGRFAEKAEPHLERLSLLALFLLMGFVLALHGRDVLGAVGTGAIAAWVLFQGATLATGHLLGGPGQGTRRVLALGSGQRNIEVGFLVAATSVGDPKALVMLVVAALVGFVVLLGTATVFGRRGGDRA